MQIIRHKTVKIALGLPLALAVAAGTAADVALTRRAAVAAVPSPAADGTPGSTWTPTRNTALAQLMTDAVAPSMVTGDSGSTMFPAVSRLLASSGQPVPNGLKDALLAVGDLPRGYVPMPDALKAFAGTGDQIGACDTRRPQPHRTGTVLPPPLDRPVASGTPEGPGLPVLPSPRIAVSPTTRPAGAPTTRPAGAPTTRPAPAVSPTTSPAPAATGAKKKNGTVRVAFMKGETGPILIEALNPAGDAAARAVVTAVADAPRRCPTYDEGRPGTPDALHMATYPLTVPRLGNKSAGVRFEVEINSPRVTVHGKMIAVSVRGVALTVLLANLEEPDQGELVGIARKAVQKVNRRR